MKKQHKAQSYIYTLVTFIFVLMAQWLPPKALAGQVASNIAKDVVAFHVAGVPGLVGVNLLENNRPEAREPDVEPFRPPAGPTREEISASKGTELRTLIDNFLALPSYSLTKSVVIDFIKKTAGIVLFYSEHKTIIWEKFSSAINLADKGLFAEILYIIDPNNPEVLNFLYQKSNFYAEDFKKLDSVRKVIIEQSIPAVVAASSTTQSEYIRYENGISEMASRYLRHL